MTYMYVPLNYDPTNRSSTVPVDPFNPLLLIKDNVVIMYLQQAENG